MKMRKGFRKTVAAALALCMSLTTVPAVFADEGGQTQLKLGVTTVSVPEGSVYSVGLVRDADGNVATDANGNVSVEVVENTLHTAGRNITVSLGVATPEGVAGNLTIAPKVVTPQEPDAPDTGEGGQTPDGNTGSEPGNDTETEPAAGTETGSEAAQNSGAPADTAQGEAAPAVPAAPTTSAAPAANNVPYDPATKTATFTLTLPEVSYPTPTRSEVYTLSFAPAAEGAAVIEMDVTFLLTAVPLFQITFNNDSSNIYSSSVWSSIYTEAKFNEFGAYTGQQYLEDTTEPDGEDENNENDGNTGEGETPAGGDGNDSGEAGTEGETPTEPENPDEEPAPGNDQGSYSPEAGKAALEELHGKLISNNSTVGTSKTVPFQIIVNGDIPADLANRAVLMFKTNTGTTGNPVLLGQVTEYHTDYALYNVLANIGLVHENAKAVTNNETLVFNNNGGYMGYWGSPGGRAVTATSAGAYPRTIDQWASLNVAATAFRFYANTAGTYTLTVTLADMTPLVAEEGAEPVTSVGYTELASASTDINVSNYSSGGGNPTRYTVTATAGEGGNITPKSITVGHGGSHTFKITANSGYEIDDVTVDGKSVGAVESYHFSSIKSNHTIKATFVKEGSKDKDNNNVSVNDFRDVKASDWFYDAVDYATKNGLFAGTTTSTFSPNENMTRAMFVAVLGRMADNMGIDTSGHNPAFNDVNRSSYYGSYVGWAAANNIVAGYSSSTFAPNDNITREQMAALFIRFAEYANIKLDTGSGKTYSDSGSVSSWAVSDVNKATAAGLITGYDNNTFRPQGTATRAEVCTVFMQLSQKYVDKDE